MKSVRRLLLLLSVLSLAGWLRAEPVPANPAPAWKLKDVNGKVVSSDQFKGKVVVVDFWATWCPPCRAEIPGYIALQEKYRAAGLVFVGISLDQQGPGIVRKFIADHHMNYVVVMDDGDVSTAFGGTETISAIPTTFIIDRDGQIRDRKTGQEDAASYEQAILKYLK